METLFKTYDIKLEQIGYVVVTDITYDTAQAQYTQKTIVTRGLCSKETKNRNTDPKIYHLRFI